MIKEAALVLKEVFAGHEIFRAGGDEFVVVIRNADEGKIKELIAKLNEKEEEHNVSFAAGYSLSRDSKGIEQTLREADFQMYCDKRSHYQK